VNAGFTPFESLEWDPGRHVEDLLVGTVFDIRERDLLRRLVLVDRDEAVSTLASQSDSVREEITETVAEFVRNTWSADVHIRALGDDEVAALSLHLGAEAGRYLPSNWRMPGGPPVPESEYDIRSLARRVRVAMILQR